jgi:multiple sugar transport system substrate-binding protein
MTANNTLSIPATIRQDSDTYNNQLGVTPFPHKPSGKPMRYLIFVRQAVIFKNAPHKDLAKDFLSYFIQPQNSLKYLKATGSRFQPVQTSLWSDSYWKNTLDPYLATASKILTSENTRLSNIVLNPAYSQVLAENIWGKTLTKVTVNRVNPEQAVDEAIARIKEIFDNWSKG